MDTISTLDKAAEAYPLGWLMVPGHNGSWPWVWATNATIGDHRHHRLVPTNATRVPICVYQGFENVWRELVRAMPGHAGPCRIHPASLMAHGQAVSGNDADKKKLALQQLGWSILHTKLWDRCHSDVRVGGSRWTHSDRSLSVCWREKGRHLRFLNLSVLFSYLLGAISEV